jgi:hypothetical protein
VGGWWVRKRAKGKRWNFEREREREKERERERERQRDALEDVVAVTNLAVDHLLNLQQLHTENQSVNIGGERKKERESVCVCVSFQRRSRQTLFWSCEAVGSKVGRFRSIQQEHRERHRAQGH